jgi:hypothetical protein
MGSNSSNIKHQHRFASALTLPPRNSCIHRQYMLLPGQPISPPICCSKPTLDYHSHLHNNSIILHPTSNNNLSTTNPLPSTELVQWHLLHLQSLSSLSSRAISASNSATAMSFASPVWKKFIFPPWKPMVVQDPTTNYDSTPPAKKSKVTDEKENSKERIARRGG